MRTKILTMAGAIYLISSFSIAQAAQISDSVDDYISTYTGSRLGDLDVIKADVTYNPSTDIFHLTSTYAANVGLTAGGAYVLGFNTGTGAKSFQLPEISNVKFDVTATLKNDGTGVVGSNNLAPGSIIINGNSLTADIPGNLILGIIDKTAYTWNLWPRDTVKTQNSDFAPNNGMEPVRVVPIPGAAYLFFSALAFLAPRIRRRT